MEAKARNRFGKEADGSQREYIGCPEALLTKEFYEMLELWIEWRMFGLRYPGAVGDQPAMYLDIIKTFELHSRMIESKSKNRNEGSDG